MGGAAAEQVAELAAACAPAAMDARPHADPVWRSRYKLSS